MVNYDFAREVDMGLALNILDRLSGRVPGAGFKALRGQNAMLNLSLTGPWKGKATGPTRNLLPSRQDIFFIHSSFRLMLASRWSCMSIGRRDVDGCYWDV